LIIVFNVILLTVLSVLVIVNLNGLYKKTLVATVLFIKIAIGLAISWIYINIIRGGDTVSLFILSKEILASHTSPFSFFYDLFFSYNDWYYGETRNSFFATLIAPFTFISGNNYWLTNIYLSLLNFTTSLYLANQVNQRFSHLKNLCMISFILLPGSLIWTSGVFKETIVFSVIAISFAFFLRFYYSEFRKYHYLFLSLFFLPALLKLKFFVFLALIVGIIIVFLITAGRGRNLTFKIFILSIPIIILFAVLPYLHPWLTFDRIPITLYDNYFLLIENTANADNVVDIGIKPTYLSLIISIPKAFVLGLFRPILNFNNVLTALFSIENTIILILFSISIYNWKDIRINSLSIGLLVFVVVLALIFGLTTPNLGTIYRYKCAFSPFLFFLCAYIPFRLYHKRKETN